MRRPEFLRLLLAGSLALLGLMAPVRAEQMAEPVLVLRHEGREVAMERADLMALPQVKLTTHTLYTDGPQHFEGPLIRDILDQADMTGLMVTAIALNDYVAEIPADDFYRFDVIAALSQNGKVLSVRDKGPIWIVYPRDSISELQNGDYEYRWVWQLKELNVR